MDTRRERRRGAWREDGMKRPPTAALSNPRPSATPYRPLDRLVPAHALRVTPHPTSRAIPRDRDPAQPPSALGQARVGVGPRTVQRAVAASGRTQLDMQDAAGGVRRAARRTVKANVRRVDLLEVGGGPARMRFAACARGHLWPELGRISRPHPVTSPATRCGGTNCWRRMLLRFDRKAVGKTGRHGGGAEHHELW